MTAREAEPSDAELAMIGHEIPEQLALKYFGGTNVIMYDEVQAISRAYLQLLAASRLSRRSAEGGVEGLRENVAKTMQQAIIDANQRWNLTDAMASTVADAILALVSPAATRRAALEEVIAECIEMQGRLLAYDMPASLIEQLGIERVVTHCRRLAQADGEGG